MSALPVDNPNTELVQGSLLNATNVVVNGLTDGALEIVVTENTTNTSFYLPMISNSITGSYELQVTPYSPQINASTGITTFATSITFGTQISSTRTTFSSPVLAVNNTTTGNQLQLFNYSGFSGGALSVPMIRGYDGTNYGRQLSFSSPANDSVGKIYYSSTDTEIATVADIAAINQSDFNRVTNINTATPYTISLSDGFSLISNASSAGAYVFDYTSSSFPEGFTVCIHNGNSTSTITLIGFIGTNIITTTSDSSNTYYKVEYYSGSWQVDAQPQNTYSQWATVADIPSYAYGTWTPTDASGAGLIFTGVSANFVKIGRQCTVQFNVTYPSTGSTVAANISLPYTSVASQQNFYARVDTLTTGLSLGIPASVAYVALAQLTGNTAYENTNLATHTIYATFTYITAS